MAGAPARLHRRAVGLLPSGGSTGTRSIPSSSWCTGVRYRLWTRQSAYDFPSSAPPSASSTLTTPARSWWRLAAACSIGAHSQPGRTAPPPDGGPGQPLHYSNRRADWRTAVWSLVFVVISVVFIANAIRHGATFSPFFLLFPSCPWSGSIKTSFAPRMSSRSMEARCVGAAWPVRGGTCRQLAAHVGSAFAPAMGSCPSWSRCGSGYPVSSCRECPSARGSAQALR